MSRTLLIAIGNSLRRDDGIAHAALGQWSAPGAEQLSVMQLTPELAETIAPFDTVIFLDADIGANAIKIEPVSREASPPSLSHASSPAGVAALARALYGFQGEALVCRIPAADFSFGEGLSGAAYDGLTMHTVVLGLGNLVHGDDGVGVHAIHRLQNETRIPPGTTLMDGGTHGLNLMPHLSGCERLLVIDAIDAGQSPGTLIRLEGEEADKLPGKPSVHQLGFADLMIGLRLLGETPPEVVVIGVQPQSTEWSTDLTEPVRNSLDDVVDAVIEQLHSWTAGASRQINASSQVK